MPGVFVLNDKNTLVSLEAAHFASEDDFQVLLAKFPELLAGDQIDPSNPRRWVLVKREVAVPSEENGGGRWSLDHLFLDQDGVPTLVEVKRQTDTRIRREVVGQMLDYAANCVVYWPVDNLKVDFEATCQGNGTTPAEALSALLGPEPDIEDFWLRVKTNLAASRIRLLFVSDAIPSELRRIIEFLNNNMDPTEVLGLELRQFQGMGFEPWCLWWLDKRRRLFKGATQHHALFETGTKIPFSLNLAPVHPKVSCRPLEELSIG